MWKLPAEIPASLSVDDLGLGQQRLRPVVRRLTWEGISSRDSDMLIQSQPPLLMEHGDEDDLIATSRGERPQVLEVEA